MPHRNAAQSCERPTPFESYAQLVRMLAPAADKIAFYDDKGDALWISDGVEEPELRNSVEALLSRYAAKRVGEAPFDHTSRNQAAPTCVLPIHDAQRRLLGAMGIVCREDRNQRHAATLARLLAPLLEILSHGWRPDGLGPTKQIPAPHSPAAIKGDGPPPSPARLRRTLALVAQQVECAFSAIVAADRPFLLSHRSSPNDSDLEMNAAIDAVRAHMLKLMRTRRDPLIANRAAPGGAQFAPYKFLIFPVRSPADSLVALIMLFRKADDRDFVSWDIDAIEAVAAELPEAALAEFARTPAPAPIAILDSQGDAAHRPGAQATAAALQTGRRVGSPPTTYVQPITMDGRIRLALREGGFDLFTQRITSLRDAQRPARFEVLLRMQDAEHLRAPHAFFAAAEAGRLMPDLDRWVITTLLQRLRENSAQVRAAGLEFCINIAAQSLTFEGFSEFIVAEVCRSGIPAGLLVFEFSEANALEHQNAVEVMSARLRDVGCRIALDNCRAGFGTLGTLRKWPVSCVKLDGALIRDIVSSTRSESLVRAVVHLAGDRGIETVAECVETESVREKLLEIGVDYAQGFHLEQPLPMKRLFR